MYQLQIPGLGEYKFEHIVFDYNGTLATHGEMPKHLIEKLERLSTLLQVHVLSKDTFGTVREALKDTHILVAVVSETLGTEAKLKYVEELGTNVTIAVGNGSIDTKMLREAALGIAVIGHEGLSAKAMRDADLIFTSIDDVFNVLFDPMSLIATMRE